AASAARPAAPVFRWSIRPTINRLPGSQGESRDTPCPAMYLQVLRGSTRFVQRPEREERTPKNPVEPRRTCQNPILECRPRRRCGGDLFRPAATEPCVGGGHLDPEEENHGGDVHPHQEHDDRR